MRVNIVLRIFVALIAAIFLLVPGLLTAMAWTALNLLIALVAVLICILIAFWLPKWRWISAVIASLLIAVPPYPSWLWADEKHGWHLHLGYKLQHLELGGFAVLFLIAMLLFAVIFWAIGNRRATKP